MKNRQLKITITEDQFQRYRSHCSRTGVSMTKDIEEYIDKTLLGKGAFCLPRYRVDTKPHRRHAIETVATALIQQVYDAEQTYHDNIPESLQGGPAFEASEDALSNLEEILDLLACAMPKL